MHEQKRIPYGLIYGFLGFTAAGIVLYWGLVGTGSVEVSELVPGFLPWFYSFPVADFWIALSAILAIVYLRQEKPVAAIWLAVAGSGLLFLALNALLFGHNTGLLYHQTFEEYIEIAVKVYSLTVGSGFIFAGIRYLNNQIARVEQKYL